MAKPIQYCKVKIIIIIKKLKKKRKENDAAKNIGVCVLFESVLSFSLNIYPEVELMDNMIVLFVFAFYFFILLYLLLLLLFLLYNIVLILPYINMHLPRVYMCCRAPYATKFGHI